MHQTEILKLLSSMSAKTTPRDLISTMLLKECSRVITVIITKLAITLHRGHFPMTVQARPGLSTSEESRLSITAQPNTDRCQSKTPKARCLSICTWQSWYHKLHHPSAFSSRNTAKLIPQVAPSFCLLQSEYRKLHSMETVLLKIVKHLFKAVVIILVILALSTTFDTIDH